MHTRTFDSQCAPFLAFVYHLWCTEMSFCSAGGIACHVTRSPYGAQASFPDLGFVVNHRLHSNLKCQVASSRLSDHSTS